MTPIKLLLDGIIVASFVMLTIYVVLVPMALVQADRVHGRAIQVM